MNRRLPKNAFDPIKTAKNVFDAFNEDKATRLAAAIAYSTIFSIAPLFIVLIAILGSFVGGHAGAENKLIDLVAKNAGQGAADTVRQIVSASFKKPRQGVIAQAVGWVAFAFGATGLFASLQDALNSVWHVETAKGGWKQMLRGRLTSFGMVLVVGFLLLLTFVANGAIAFVGTHFLAQIPLGANPAVIAAINLVASYVLVTVIFALLYKVLPDVDVAWRDVWIGAAVTSLLFIIGESLISLYIARGGVASAYGAAGSLLVALLWIYYSALILLLGAEFTKVNAQTAALLAPSVVRYTAEHPAGVDPRFAREPTQAE
jgi:membrane protein